MSLYERLTEYCGSDMYPFHMPGHKRRPGPMQDPFSFDITEIDGFDNLHHAEGILLDAEKRAAALYHSSETHFLVNGSTAGILSAVTSCVPPGGLLLMARNSHKSAYHAVSLKNIRTQYLYPRPAGDLNGPVDPSDVERALEKAGDDLPDAVFLTSPTYDGIVSDVEAIARIAHRRRIPLIVDEAHGAHFGMHPAFPQSSVILGADLVVHSLHKTLPSLTQTALIHVNGDLTDRRKLRSMLTVFQTSSPSYVLMASIDSCIQTLSEHGDEWFGSYVNLLEQFRRKAQFPQIRLLRTDDPSRILLSPRNMTAGKLYALLRDRYHLQPEMLAPSYVLMLSSAADSEEGFRRLLQALTELNNLPKDPDLSASSAPEASATGDEMQEPEYSESEAAMQKPVSRCTIGDALSAPQQKTPFRDAAGRISAEYLYLYPPGVPLLAPGEEITPALIRRVNRLSEAGYGLQGTEDYTHSTIWTVKEDTSEQ